MFVVAVVLSCLLAVAFLGTGVMKVTGQAQIVEGLAHLGVSSGLTRLIGTLEVAGAAGMLVGLAVGWLGVAAAAGLFLLMVGAVGYHVRAGDYKDPKYRGGAIMPIVLIVLSAVTGIFRLLTI
jgi:hypothetical protein